jgi:hypothetical protein
VSQYSNEDVESKNKNDRGGYTNAQDIYTPLDRDIVSGNNPVLAQTRFRVTPFVVQTTESIYTTVASIQLIYLISSVSATYTPGKGAERERALFVTSSHL